MMTKSGSAFSTSEVVYFVNNQCNLKCKHCYVGYKNTRDELKVQEWNTLFDQFISIGARSFSNVGKEPLLSWEKTKSIMAHLNQKRQEVIDLKFGLTTNATYLTEKIIEDLSEINPDYINISIDGTKNIHDEIRGDGNYKKTIENIVLLKKNAPNLLNKTQILYTLMANNKEVIKEAIEPIQEIGIRSVYISPYTSSLNASEKLELTDKQIADIYKKICEPTKDLLNLKKDFHLILAIDSEIHKTVVNLLKKNKIILNNQYISHNRRYSAHKQKNGGTVLVEQSRIRFPTSVLISHDGYVGSCEDMFSRNYSRLAKGNVKKEKISNLLN
ncbi:MAG: radical SAM protein [Nanoarchaeota archaeon]|nr:radical SAM protein [Nanoarchaeota archaeon]